MAVGRKLILTGSDVSGWTWTCGTCGVSAPAAAATVADAYTGFDLHYTTAPSVAVDQWLLDTLTAAKGLYDATSGVPAVAAQVKALRDAVASGPPGILATWKAGGITHPQ